MDFYDLYLNLWMFSLLNIKQVTILGYEEHKQKKKSKKKKWWPRRKKTDANKKWNKKSFYLCMFNFKQNDLEKIIWIYDSTRRFNSSSKIL